MSAPLYEVFVALLYEEDMAHVEALNNLKKIARMLGITAYYIRHDKDVYSANDEGEKHAEGELKKPHIHLVMFCSKRTEAAASKVIGVKSNYVQGSRNGRLALAYLTHPKELYPEKYQYKDSEVIGINASVPYRQYMEQLPTAQTQQDKRIAFDCMVSKIARKNKNVNFLTVMREADKQGIGSWVTGHIVYCKTVLEAYREASAYQEGYGDAIHKTHAKVDKLQKDKQELEEMIERLIEQVQTLANCPFEESKESVKH